uniref:Acyl-CoA dehydrogenase n=1 Tax=Mucochytrium quahogii TaxID=96639 RepID=A0A7S2W5N4_9STRA|mmetsp:Transcript_20779/g.33898  ORF Transcript_20779/g.33898 Transcript_20779/m.33898 type:complete len:604 (-) Transcript_20779:361-2172(-)|eukprot:CAMPEP_0203761716 /NCGR_PEP_ID=MMETSP0098-20131031/14741_1 /ASSEMBLY_ACC=CAM_ASM_000208 /TAXON_ID=96639 /ORGANISM=" , Strain NY0313808BC1" /LENGTH=603 /DNA_ID=CAMNT_0050655829 /DNA_START=167 /DNA_END=1978 /DNA_ORIENTATION=-
MSLEARISYSQSGPRIGNPWLEDECLQRFTRLLLDETNCDATDQQRVETDLASFGDKCSNEYMNMAENAARFPPQLEQFDQWGQRIDKLHLSEGWKYFMRETAVEGLAGIPYESSCPSAYIHQAVKLLLYEPSSSMAGCPLAMTHGAAAVIRHLLKEQEKNPYMQHKTVAALKHAFERLTTRDPTKSWTSGQWFTEKQGGSDLSKATQTFAIENQTSASTHKLSGFKWFTSAVDAQMTLTLASITKDSTVEMHNERKPLSLFFLETRKHAKTSQEEELNGDMLNGIKVIRLKDKMGTKQLPTAELVLENAGAHLVSPVGAGIKAVAPMLHVTRLHNALTAVSYMLRIRNIATDFAHRRHAFGSTIVDKPLHLQELVEYDMDSRGNLLLALEVSRLLGRVENGVGTDQDDGILRVISSLAKVFTSHECNRLMIQGSEMCGAVGLMTNHISRLRADASVLSVWEGSHATLSLDLLRIARREPEAITALEVSLKRTVEANSELLPHVNKMFESIAVCTKDLKKFEWNAFRLTMNLSRLIVTCLVWRTWLRTKHPEDRFLVEHWTGRLTREMVPIRSPEAFEQMRKFIPQSMRGNNRDSRGLLRSKV